MRITIALLMTTGLSGAACVGLVGQNAAVPTTEETGDVRPVVGLVGQKATAPVTASKGEVRPAPGTAGVARGRGGEPTGVRGGASSVARGRGGEPTGVR